MSEERQVPQVSRLDPRTGWVRGVRAGAVSTQAVAATAVAHAAGGGCLPSLGLALSLGLAWPVAVLVMGRRRHPVVLGLLLLTLQASTHLTLHTVCSTPGQGQVGFWTLALHDLGWGMIRWHLLAAVLATPFLARADAGLWTATAVLRLARRLRLALAGRRRPAVICGVARDTLLPLPPALVGRLASTAHGVRGPPRTVAAF